MITELIELLHDARFRLENMGSTDKTDADLIERIMAHVDRFNVSSTPEYLEKLLIQVGVCDIEWQQRAEDAEAELAQIMAQEPIGYVTKAALDDWRCRRVPHAYVFLNTSGDLRAPIYAAPVASEPCSVEVRNQAIEEAAVAGQDCVHLTPDVGNTIRILKKSDPSQIVIKPVASEAETIERIAKHLDSKVTDYAQEHGRYDHETGQTEFSDDGLYYVSTLEELAEEIRALSGKESS